MDITAQEYQRLSKRTAPRSPALADCLKAFFVGGGICALGQGVLMGFETMGLNRYNASLLTTVSLIFFSALLTGLGWYNRLAKHAGAGTLVPITGFANAIASPALEFKTEGFVLGVGAKMFTIAGPVIVYGTMASVVYGIIYWITTLF